MCDDNYAQRLEDGFLMMAEDVEPESLEELLADLDGDNWADEWFSKYESISKAVLADAQAETEPDVHREFARPCRNSRLV